ncbi:MAG: hypothetical protein JWP41_3706, partial [Ramlibacter sp.]|nr:hypothetical protein [Ramlibacter sp.]
MISWFYKAALAAAVTGLAGCGGGGDDGPAAPAPAAAATSAAPAAYVGAFVSACELVPEIRNLDVNAGTPVHVRPTLTVRTPSGDTAPVELRLDLYQDSACSTASLGAIQYGGTASRVVFDGPRSAGTAV